MTRTALAFCSQSRDALSRKNAPTKWSINQLTSGDGHFSDLVVWAYVRFAPMIGIGGSLAAPPLPHHRAYGSVHGGSRSCANTIDACRLGVRAHSSPMRIRCLPLPPAGLHPSAPRRSPVSTGCSAACRSRDSCPTCLSSRSGLQPSFPAHPIFCLHLSPTDGLTSLSDALTYSTLCSLLPP